MNKLFLCVVLVASAVLVAINARSLSKPKIDKVAEFLLSTDTELLDDSAKSVAKDFIREYELNNGGHYCCKVPAKNETIEIRTRVVTKNVVVSTQIVTGHKPCDASATTTPVPQTTQRPGQYTTTKFPWCTGEPIYSTVTHMSVEYEVESYEVVVVTSVCSPENTICCSGYTMILNQCINSALAGNLGGLIDLGIIG